MKKKIIALTGAALLGITAFAGVARGLGGVAAAAEDERFRMNGTTLTAYLGTDAFVSIPDTVTVIGSSAFEGNETLTGIEIPDSVSTISYNAFKGCTALTGVIIPDTVKKVGPGAFEGCTALSSVEIGEQVSSWGTGVFIDCDSLAAVTVDKDNDYITAYNGAIYNGNMTMLYQALPGREGDNYVMPETVEDIDAYAFWNLKNTKNVMLSDKISVVPKYAMSSMGAVENVVLPDSVTTISQKAFADSEALKQVSVPASVRQIDAAAFSQVPNMKIFTTKDSNADAFGKEKGIPVIYKAEYPTDFLDSNANYDEMPNVGQSGSDANDRNNGNDADNANNDVNSGTDGGTDDVEPPTSGSESEAPSNNASGSTQSVLAGNYIHPLDVPEAENVIGKTVVVAGRAVFLIDNRKETVYGVPKGVAPEIITQEQERGQEAGTAPEQNASGENASEQQASEQGFEQNASEPKVSSGSSNTVSVTVEREMAKNDTTIPQRKYYQQKDLTNYEISETIEAVGRLAFAESGLKGIQIPDHVTVIEYGAFMNCAALEQVTIPDTAERIGTKAFSGTPWLENWLNKADGGDKSSFLVVGDGILLAYRGSNATHVTVPEGVKQIGSEAFKGHSEIINVELPESVTKICAEAFRNCDSLVGLSGCKGLKTIIRGAFYGTQVSESDFMH